MQLEPYEEKLFWRTKRYRLLKKNVPRSWHVLRLIKQRSSPALSAGYLIHWSNWCVCAVIRDLAEREITCNIGPSQPPPGAKVRTVGEVIMCDQNLISFEIGTTELSITQHYDPYHWASNDITEFRSCPCGFNALCCLGEGSFTETC